MIRDLQLATGSYARALTGAAGVVNIPRYQCRIFADTDCSFVFVDITLNLLTAVPHCLQSVYGCVIWRSGARGCLQQSEGHKSFLVTSALERYLASERRQRPGLSILIKGTGTSHILSRVYCAIP